MKEDTNQSFEELLIYIQSLDCNAVKKILQDNVTLDINERDRRGETALHYAIKAGSNQIVNILLDKKYAVDAKSRCNSTPLYISACRNYFDGAEALITSIEDQSKRKEYVNYADNKKITPLHVAMFNKNGSKLNNLLLENGANPNAVAIGFYDIEDHSNLTPLHLAALLGNLEAVAILVSYDADKTKVTKEGQTALALYQEMFGNKAEFDAAVKKGEELREERIQAERAKVIAAQTTLDSNQVASSEVQGGSNKIELDKVQIATKKQNYVSSDNEEKTPDPDTKTARPYSVIATSPLLTPFIKG
jgi:hypothetical protein